MKFYDIRAQGEGIEIRLYGDIVQDQWGKWTQDDTCPSDISEALKEAGDKPLIIRINSGGGSVFGGLAIYNVLRGYKGKKTVYVDGIAASIASVIMLAGDEVFIPANAFVMLHPPWGICVGEAEDMRAYADSLDLCARSIYGIYAANYRDGVDIEAEQAKIADEHWMLGEEAAELFKNVVCTDAVQVAAQVSAEQMRHYRNAPEDFLRAKKVEEATQEITGNTGGAASDLHNQAALLRLESFVAKAERKME